MLLSLSSLFDVVCAETARRVQTFVVYSHTRHGRRRSLVRHDRRSSPTPPPPPPLDKLRSFLFRFSARQQWRHRRRSRVLCPFPLTQPSRRSTSEIIFAITNFAKVYESESESELDAEPNWEVLRPGTYISYGYTHEPVERVVESMGVFRNVK